MKLSGTTSCSTRPSVIDFLLKRQAVVIHKWLPGAWALQSQHE
jgi:hypothetical protein